MRMAGWRSGVRILGLELEGEVDEEEAFWREDSEEAPVCGRPPLIRSAIVSTFTFASILAFDFGTKIKLLLDISGVK